MRIPRSAFSAMLLVLLTLACAPRSWAGDLKRISPEEAKALLAEKKVFLLDVRTREEYQAQRIPGTDALIPLQELEARLKELSAVKEKPILVYCRSANRSLRAAELLQKHGFTDVMDMKGGIRQWSSLGYGTESGPAPK